MLFYLLLPKGWSTNPRLAMGNTVICWPQVADAMTSLPRPLLSNNSYCGDICRDWQRSPCLVQGNCEMKLSREHPSQEVKRETLSQQHLLNLCTKWLQNQNHLWISLIWPITFLFWTMELNLDFWLSADLTLWIKPILHMRNKWDIKSVTQGHLSGEVKV